jgi:hypothetical protein
MHPSSPRRWSGSRVSGLFLLLCGCVGCFGCGGPKVSPDAVKRVEKGMTVSQVERILGPGRDGREPPDDNPWDGEWLKAHGVPADAAWKHWPDPAETRTQRGIVYNIAFVDGKVAEVIVHSVSK